jgi:AcrR family transcriptional regulator
LEKSEAVVPILPVPGTREAILEAARRLFEERGYDATSLRQIAESVGTTKAAVYYHFPAKEHLLLELTRPMLDDLADMVARVRESGSGVEDAPAVLEAYLDLFLNHLPVLTLLGRDPATHSHPDIGMRGRMLIEAVQQHISGDDPTPERLTRAACAVSVVSAVAALPPELVRSQRSVVLDAAIAALSPPGPHPAD